MIKVLKNFQIIDSEIVFSEVKGYGVSMISLNDIYVFFESIGQLEPQSVLDMGMLLKRIGAISRKALNVEVPEDVRLVGIDTLSEINFIVWRNIYDEIIDVENFFKNPGLQNYDLAICIKLKEIQIKVPFSDLLKKIRKNTRYILSDYNFDVWTDNVYRVHEWKVENDIYYLIDFGE